jgi:hypothetical protein
MHMNTLVDCIFHSCTIAIGELARILNCKGRVFAMDDEPDVPRMWLPNQDAPGLAMARAFGDFCLKNHGLICTPEVYCRKLSEKDEFLVLATDGVIKKMKIHLIGSFRFLSLSVHSPLTALGFFNQKGLHATIPNDLGTE